MRLLSDRRLVPCQIFYAQVDCGVGADWIRQKAFHPFTCWVKSLTVRALPIEGGLKQPFTWPETPAQRRALGEPRCRASDIAPRWSEQARIKFDTAFFLLSGVYACIDSGISFLLLSICLDVSSARAFSAANSPSSAFSTRTGLNVSAATRLQTPHVPPSLAQCLQ
jgi:hypothetical protein